jgi:rRNA maturation endonuclease Nob1
MQTSRDSKIDMYIDFSVYNHCNTCKIKYPKDKIYCDVCGRRVRSKSRIVKSEVRERMKNLASKRY